MIPLTSADPVYKKLKHSINAHIENNEHYLLKEDCDVLIPGTETMQCFEAIVISKANEHILDEVIKAAPEIVIKVIPDETDIHEYFDLIKKIRESGIKEFWAIEKRTQSVNRTFCKSKTSYIVADEPPISSYVLEGLVIDESVLD